MTSPAILTVDLSLTGTGICHPDGTTQTIRTSPKDGSHVERIVTLRNQIMDRARHADLVVLEDIARGAKGSAVHTLAGLAYTVRVSLHCTGEPWIVIGTGQLKKYATGKGTSDKTAMALDLQSRADLRLPNDNEVDAKWLWLMTLDAYGSCPIDMPKSHRAVLSKIDWPNVVPA